MKNLFRILACCMFICIAAAAPAMADDIPDDNDDIRFGNIPTYINPDDLPANPPLAYPPSEPFHISECKLECSEDWLDGMERCEELFPIEIDPESWGNCNEMENEAKDQCQSACENLPPPGSLI